MLGVYFLIFVLVRLNYLLSLEASLGGLLLPTVFGNVALDLLIAFILGAFGGFVAELIENKGNLRSITKLTSPERTWNLGLWSNVIIGGAAALVIFFMIGETDAYKFVGSAVLAGVGGSAVLVAVKEQFIASLLKRLTEQANQNAQEGKDTIDKLENELKMRSVDANDATLAKTMDDAKVTSGAMQKEIDRIKRELNQLG